MGLLYLRDVLGNEAPVVPTSATLTRTVNQVSQLDLTFANNGVNSAAAKMVQPRTLLVDSNTREEYRIQTTSGTNIGDYRSYRATFLGTVHDLNDHYVSGTLTATQSLDSCMRFITSGTGFSYTIHDSFANYSFSEGFGTGMAFDLFLNTLMSDFDFEWSSNGRHIDIYKAVGRRAAFVWLDGLDVYSLADESDYTQIATHISGTGKVDDNQKPLATADYTSPYATTWGVIDADPVSDERFTSSDTLLAYLKVKLQDYPLIQRTASLNIFQQNTPVGQLNDATVGNYGYIRDRNGIDVETRISETVTDLADSASSSITFGNMSQSFTQITAGLQAAHNISGKEIEDIKTALDSKSEVGASFRQVGVGNG